MHNHKNEKGYVAATAHPVKFPDVIVEVLKQEVPIPDNVKHLFALEKKSIPMQANYNDFKSWLLTIG